MEKGANKLGKYLFMKGSSQLASHLPETKRMTKNSFWYLITKYGQVILKPNGGSGGVGVIQITDQGNGKYGIHMNRTRITVKGKKRTLAILTRKMGYRKHIVQRRINLVTVEKRPIDIRIIVQRRKNTSEWQVTGEVAKVAGKGYIVTNNTRSKGILLPISDAIRKSSIRNGSPETLMSDLHQIALLSAQRLLKMYPNKNIFGLDMGLDQNGHVWIIEANKAPSMSHFLKLKDRTMYRKIMDKKGT
jgi:hypothetical protein